MSSLSERSVMHIFGVTTLVIMTSVMPMITTESSPILSPLSSPSSPASLLFHPTDEEKNQQQGGDQEIRESYQLLQQDYHQKANNFLEDYGVWNPTPRSGGAYASPVPHAKDRRYTYAKSFRD